MDSLPDCVVLRILTLYTQPSGGEISYPGSLACVSKRYNSLCNRFKFNVLKKCAFVRLGVHATNDEQPVHKKVLIKLSLDKHRVSVPSHIIDFLESEEDDEESSLFVPFTPQEGWKFEETELTIVTQLHVWREELKWTEQWGDNGTITASNYIGLLDGVEQQFKFYEIQLERRGAHGVLLTFFDWYGGRATLEACILNWALDFKASIYYLPETGANCLKGYLSPKDRLALSLTAKQFEPALQGGRKRLRQRIAKNHITKMSRLIEYFNQTKNDPAILQLATKQVEIVIGCARIIILSKSDHRQQWPWEKLLRMITYCVEEVLSKFKLLIDPEDAWELHYWLMCVVREFEKLNQKDSALNAMRAARVVPKLWSAKRHLCKEVQVKTKKMFENQAN